MRLAGRAQIAETIIQDDTCPSRPGRTSHWHYGAEAGGNYIVQDIGGG